MRIKFDELDKNYADIEDEDDLYEQDEFQKNQSNSSSGDKVKKQIFDCFNKLYNF